MTAIAAPIPVGATAPDTPASAGGAVVGAAVGGVGGALAQLAITGRSATPGPSFKMGAALGAIFGAVLGAEMIDL